MLAYQISVSWVAWSETTSFRLNPILGGVSGDPNFFLDISSSWVERSLHAKFQLPRLPGSGSIMVVDKKNQSVELLASLAPAKAEVGAVAKADQNSY